MGVAAGTYDRRVSISQQVKTQTTSGQYTISWSAVLTDCPARLIPQGGSQNYEGEQRVSNNNLVFHVRYNGIELKAGMQLVYNGLNYNIVSTQEVGRKVAIELRCETKDNQ